MRHWILRLLVVAVVALVARPAAADDKATRDARRHWEKGEKLFALGRFDEALVAYEQAFEAKPLPGFLFNIGQCHRNLGNYDAAIFSFRKFLKLDPDTAKKDAVLELIEELEDKKKAEEDSDRERKLMPVPPERPPGGEPPIYKKWWFWGGVAAVAGASAGGYFLLRGDGVPDSNLGNVVFR
jgi:tetratricopeptide (TPR) repeat protein